MLKPPRADIHSGSQKINKLILSSIENQERKVIELIPQNTKEHRYESERLRNILRLRGYSKSFIRNVFQNRHLARTDRGLALIPCGGDVTNVMVLGEGFALVASLDGGEPS